MLAALLAALGAPQAQGAKEAAFDFCANPSGAGALGGECLEPRGLAVNESGAGGVPEGTVYVADRGNRRVQSFTPEGSFLRAWGKDVVAGGGEGFEVCETAAECKRGRDGAGAGELNDIGGGIAVNQATGEVYVVERDNFRIQQFSATGGFVRMWGRDVDATGGEGFEVCDTAADCKAGEAGEGAGMFGFGATGALAGIGVDEAGEVYVADAGRSDTEEIKGAETFRVQKFDSEGGFLRMGGWDVDAVGLGSGYEVCATAVNCKGGTAGAGAGQFSNQSPDHLAVGAGGEAYVVDARLGKVVRLDSELGLVADPFAAAALEGPGTLRAVAVDWGSGEVHLAVRDRIHVIDPDSEEEAAAPIETEPGGEEISNWFGLAIDSASGWMFAACGDSDCEDAIRAFEPVERLEARTRPAAEVGAEAASLRGQVKPEGEPPSECAFEYDTTPYDEGEAPHGEFVPCAEYEAGGEWLPLASSADLGTGAEFVAVRAKATDLHPGTVYHYRVRAANERPEEEGQGGPEEAVGGDAALQTLGPAIAASWAWGVGEAEATLAADIDPEGNTTTYRFEYGTGGPCSEPASACVRVPAPEGDVGADSATHRVARRLEGLRPGATYRWRVVATDSEGIVNEGPDRAFTTYKPPGPQSCPNEALRAGTPSAALPDCRGYEMVSPVDKNGGDIVAAPDTGEGFETSYRQASREGERLTYSSTTAFAGAPRGTRSNQYLSSRGAGGWSTEPLLPEQGRTVFDPSFDRGYDLNTNFQAFTPDLCRAVMRDHNLEPLAPGAIEGFTNLYLRENCGPGAGGYEALSVGGVLMAPGKDIGPAGYAHSADLRHFIFRAFAALDAAPAPAANFEGQVYDSVGGRLRLVSVLPGGEADPERSTVGSFASEGRASNLARAVSGDGSRAFWSSGSGFVYMRANPGEAPSEPADGGASGEGRLSAGSTEVTGVVTETGSFAAGQTVYGAGIPRGTTIAAVGAGALTLSAEASETSEVPTALVSGGDCEAARACTVPVSSGGGETIFWTADPSGSKAIYGEDGGLYELDVDAALAGAGASAVSEIAAGAEGFAGASEDLSRVYFTSSEALAAGAREGEPNLYLREAGAEPRLVARLAAGDSAATASSGETYRVDDPVPLRRAGRLSADGRVLTFMSRSARLAEAVAGYDDIDTASGEPAAQVYRYDSEADGGAGELVCISCNPSGARPEAQRPPQPYNAVFGTAFPAAAWLPTCEWSNYCKRSLAADGERVFFNAFDALLPEDRNGAQDVYQWEAPDTGTCTKADPRYFPGRGGCISLLSTGRSPEDSTFLDASASGDDAFLTTASDIDPRDLAFIDVYDARAGGGFPPPPEERSPCVGDACQSVPGAPEAPAPASEGYAGPGNPAAAPGGCAGPARRARALARRAKRMRRAARRSDSARRSRALRRRARGRARKAKRLSRKAKRCRKGSRR